MNDLCGQLEYFLAGDLHSRERDDFELHLQECADCRSEAESQAYLNGLLADAAAAFDRCPPTLLSRVEATLDRAHRRRVVASFAVAVIVAGVLVGSGWLLLGGAGRQPAPDDRQKSVIAKHQKTNGTPTDSHRPEQQDGRNDPPTTSEKVVVRFSDNVITQTLVDDNPNFTLIWVYPVQEFASEEDPPE